MVEMELLSVRLELPANAPIVLLQELGGARRVLPIYIGTQEATAIAYAMEKVETKRPLTHDLFRDVIGALGASLTRVVVTEMREHTYYAELHFDLAGTAVVVSARPSDSVALAVRTGAPIFASEAVLDECAKPAAMLEEADDDKPEGESEELVDEFRQFLEQISPDDFGS